MSVLIGSERSRTCIYDESSITKKAAEHLLRFQPLFGVRRSQFLSVLYDCPCFIHMGAYLNWLTNFNKTWYGHHAIRKHCTLVMCYNKQSFRRAQQMNKYISFKNAHHNSVLYNCTRRQSNSTYGHDWTTFAQETKASLWSGSLSNHFVGTKTHLHRSLHNPVIWRRTKQR
jgi:hypothetical protein